MSNSPRIRSDSSPGPSPKTLWQRLPSAAIWAAGKRLIATQSLSRVQAVIGTLAGIISIAGAALSVAHASHSTNANTGTLVAIVKASGGRISVPDATIEVLTAQNAIVATLTPDSNGRAAQELPEGVYIVRISDPRYAAAVSRVKVLPRQTVEIRASLRAGSSSSADHAVSVDHAVASTVGAVRRALHF